LIRGIPKGNYNIHLLLQPFDPIVAEDEILERQEQLLQMFSKMIQNSEQTSCGLSFDKSFCEASGLGYPPDHLPQPFDSNVAEDEITEEQEIENQQILQTLSNMIQNPDQKSCGIPNNPSSSFFDQTSYVALGLGYPPDNINNLRPTAFEQTSCETREFKYVPEDNNIFQFPQERKLIRFPSSPIGLTLSIGKPKSNSYQKVIEEDLENSARQGLNGKSMYKQLFESTLPALHKVCGPIIKLQYKTFWENHVNKGWTCATSDTISIESGSDETSDLLLVLDQGASGTTGLGCFRFGGVAFQRV
jgi:hypothetical protein